MKKIRTSLAWALPAVLLLAAGCSDDGDNGETDNPTPNPFPTSITASPSTVTLDEGATQQLSVSSVLNTGATSSVLASEATFSSGDDAIATVSDSGLVTAVAEGQTTITVTAFGFDATVSVTVNSATVDMSTIAVVDDAYGNIVGFGEGGAPLHTGDNMCPMRAGGERGNCHRLVWDGTGGGFTGQFWLNGDTFANSTPVMVPAGATELTFWAWSMDGTPGVEFGAGDTANGDLGQIRQFINLSTTPTMYTVSLANLAGYTTVYGGFVVALNTGLTPNGATIYVDDIRWTVGNSPEALTLPMTVDDNFTGFGSFGEGGPPHHTNDNMCPMRAGGENGNCHRFQWDGTGGGFTGSIWVNGTGFDDLLPLPIDSGATEVSFWAWSTEGTPGIEFGAGDTNLGDNGQVRQVINLSTTPTRYTVSLASLAGYTEVRAPFVVALNTDLTPNGATIYVDDIQWVEGEMQQEVPLPMTIDDNFGGLAGFGEGGARAHTVDTVCPMRAGGENGLCHQFIWNGMGGGFTGDVWVNGTGFDDRMPVAVASGATEVSFWAWSAEGSPTIEFGAGDTNLGDVGQIRQNVTLSTTPTQYTVSLASLNGYTNVQAGFVVAMTTALTPSGATFYVDDIQWTTGSGGAPSQELRAHPDDRVIGYNGGTPALREANIGGAAFGDSEAGSVFVIPFVLGTIPEGGFTSASLQITVDGVAGAMENPLNADLYGLDFQTAADAGVNGVVTTAMFYASAAQDVNATLIANDFLTPSTAASSTVITDPTAQTALLNYLNAQVMAGAQAGDFVYLRLTPDLDAPIGAATTWIVSSAINDTDPPNRATLTVQ